MTNKSDKSGMHFAQDGFTLGHLQKGLTVGHIQNGLTVGHVGQALASTPAQSGTADNTTTTTSKAPTGER